MPTRKVLIAIVLIVVFTALTLFIFLRTGNYEVINHPSSDGPIVAFGDSLVVGVGAKVGKGFVDVLSERLGEPVINLGRGGDKTEDALGRIDEVLNKNPRMTLVLLGGNDFFKQSTKRKNLFKPAYHYRENSSRRCRCGFAGRPRRIALR